MANTSHSFLNNESCKGNENNVINKFNTLIKTSTTEENKKFETLVNTFLNSVRLSSYDNLIASLKLCIEYLELNGTSFYCRYRKNSRMNKDQDAANTINNKNSFKKDIKNKNSFKKDKKDKDFFLGSMKSVYRLLYRELTESLEKINNAKKKEYSQEFIRTCLMDFDRENFIYLKFFIALWYVKINKLNESKE
jgi:hypothetical protein